MNHIIRNAHFTVLKTSKYRRHIFQAVIIGVLVALVISALIGWHSEHLEIQREIQRMMDAPDITTDDDEVQRLAWTLAEALDPAVGQPLTYAQVMILLGADWQPLRDEIGLIIHQ